MRTLRWLIVYACMACGITGCKEKYDASLKPGQTNYLVVEGFINGQGITTITLSRTVRVSDTARVRPEQGATVTIAGNDNSVFNLKQTANGTYVSDLLTLNSNQQYRLQIRTASGGEYLSAFAAVKQTPPIDSISYRRVNDDVQIAVNTHDPQNNTRYYKWNYEETWEIHSAFPALIGYANGGFFIRSADEVNKIFYCWGTQNSASILTGSSAKLQNDVISQAPLLNIPLLSEKTSVRYSIVVTQHSIDRKAYDFYHLMKSNTESLGSIFDPLPSDITGNITCVNNPEEKVIGYISVSSAQQKRIFITRSQFGSRFFTDCRMSYVVNHPDSIKLAFGTRTLMPYETDGFPTKGFFASTPECIDCTLRGSNVKPTFW